MITRNIYCVLLLRLLMYGRAYVYTHIHTHTRIYLTHGIFFHFIINYYYANRQVQIWMKEAESTKGLLATKDIEESVQRTSDTSVEQCTMQ